MTTEESELHSKHTKERWDRTAKQIRESINPNNFFHQTDVSDAKKIKDAMKAIADATEDLSQVLQHHAKDELELSKAALESASKLLSELYNAQMQIIAHMARVQLLNSK